MSKITQIVRPLKRGECLPAYSTAQLLILPERYKRPSVLKMKPAEKARIFAAESELIKEMLRRFAPNSEIAAAIGVTIRYVGRHIRSTEDLTCLADARYKVSKQNGGQMGRKKSRERFAKHKEQTPLALETEAKHKVALKFGFSQKTLKVYVDEVKNGK